MLEAILASYVEAQTTNILDNIHITLGSERKVVNLKVPCFYIIGDMQGGDKLCACAPVYLRSLNRVCRSCDVQGEQTGNPNVICRRWRSKDIEALVAEKDYAALNKINQYCVPNAWFAVDFGGCPNRIFSAACPVEPLHSLENGLIADCLKVLFQERITSKNTSSMIDNLAQKFCSYSC